MNDYLKTIKKEIENLHDMQETEVKKTILEVMSMTESWMNLDELEQILPEAQYKDIKIRLEEKIKARYPKKLGWTSEKLEALYTKNIEREKFFIVKDENGKYALRRFNYGDIAADRNFSDITIEKIPTQYLNNVAINIMKRHREYNEFHKNEMLEEEEIPELLDSLIQKLSDIQNKKITSIDIEQVTKGVRIEKFKQATNTIKESAKEKQQIANKDVSLDDK